MPTSSEFHSVRWVLLPISALVAFAVGGLVGERVAIMLHLWATPATVFLAACLMIPATHLTAPKCKLQVAVLTLVTVVTVAWLNLEPWVHPRTYEPTHAPFLAALGGSVVGLLMTALLKGKARVA